MGEPSKEALDEARKLCERGGYWVTESTPLDRIAATLQRHMDATKAAEQRLSDCVQEVQAWNYLSGTDAAELVLILTRYGLPINDPRE